MTTEQLHDALTLLPADLVAAADRRRSRKIPVIRWQRWTAMAACLALILYAGSFCASLLAPKKTSSMADMEMAAAEQEAAPAEAPAAMAPAQTSEEAAVEDVPAEWEETFGSAAGQTAMVQPPRLRIESGSQALTLAAAGYTWEIPQEDGTSMGVCVDIPAPTDFPERHPVLEAETEAAELHWEIQPLSVAAQCWDEADLQREKQVELNGTTLPFCRGTHIYEITAQWENGTAVYVLLVNTHR